MNPDEIHTGESATEGGWRYRMVYIEPDLLEEVTGLRHWWFSEVTRFDPSARSKSAGSSMACGIRTIRWRKKDYCWI